MNQIKNFTAQDNIFNAIFTNALINSVILLDRNGIILNINGGFCKNFGYELKDVKGKKFDILFTEEDRANGLPDKELRTVLDFGRANDMNYLLKKDQSRVWVSGESIYVKNVENEISIVKMIQNIQVQKESEKQLERIKSFGEIILKTIDDAVLIIDSNMMIVKSNAAFERLFQIHPVKRLEVNFGDLIMPFDEHNQLRKEITKAIESKTTFRNCIIKIKSSLGELRTYDVSSAIMEEQEMEDHLFIAIHDITLSKQVENEKDDMIGFVVHELRNPLSNISLCNSIIEDSIEDGKLDDAKELLARSNNNVTRLGKMITELYNTTQLRSGNFELNFTVFNFGEMVNEAVSTINQLNAAFNITIEGETDFEITGDKFKLVEVMVNYLSNAIKYSDNRKEITIGVFNEESAVTVSVKDYGLGVPAAHLPFIFNRFYRSEKTKNLEGLGLGLYLCKRIINAHDGRVWVESKEGEGSTFYFSIPLIHIMSQTD